MTWVHDTALQGERTVGSQALVTGDGDQGAVTAPALALVTLILLFLSILPWESERGIECPLAYSLKSV